MPGTGCLEAKPKRMRTTWGVLKADHHAAEAVARCKRLCDRPSPAPRQITNRLQAALHAATDLAEQS